jgi:hypothetical protein
MHRSAVFPHLLLLGLLLASGCGDKDDSGLAGDPARRDADEDGWTADVDCNDRDAAVHPGATEITYNGIDDDCDPATPDDDLDGDGFLSSVDCADEDASIHPGADEHCDGRDEDCDGEVDDDPVDGATYWIDEDGDGYGYTHESQRVCAPPSGWVAVDGDCNDADPAVHPGATEECNGLDDDCDGEVDVGVAEGDPWYADRDGDGYGDPDAMELVCGRPSGYVADDTDCDDSDAAVFPGAEELCNGVDDDCDGEADEGLPGDVATWYTDADGDGYGDPATGVDACEQPSGTVADNTDCDDTDPRAYPGGPEVAYDGVDGDCDGASDFDVDGDGYDSDVYGGTDCDDRDASVNPGVAETWYDGVDGNCDGADDYDADGDGYDSSAFGGTDCDDRDASVHPGALETDPGVDQDCDGEVEATPTASADALSSSSFEHCSALVLDASASADPDGGALGYLWTILSVPGPSSLTDVDFDDPTAVQPTIYPDSPGTYTFGLTVTDPGGLSDSDTVSVSITTRGANVAPTADAGPDLTFGISVTCAASAYGYECEPCTYEEVVDGSGSSDADGEPLGYAWTATSGDVIFDDDTLEAPTALFTGSQTDLGTTVTDTFELSLQVTDCIGWIDNDTVTVTLECTGVE